MPDKIILETSRLSLRELRQSDFNDVCKLLQDPTVMYAYEGAFNDAEVQEWLDRQFARYKNDGFGLWGVLKKDTGELIGQCGITYQDYNGCQIPEIGYLLRKEFWHQGYATEAAKACKEYAFETLGFNQVYSIIRDTNLLSQQVATRNGMKKTDELIKHYRNTYMPHFVFTATKSPTANIEVREATENTPGILDKINELLQQLTDTPPHIDSLRLQQLIDSPTSILYLIYRNNEIAGMATVGSYLTPTGTKRWIEDVVIDKAFRGEGLGKILIQNIISIYKPQGKASLMLTSRPQRAAANKLYQTAGFKKKETNVYKIDL